MDFTTLLIMAVGLTYFGVTMYIANQEDAAGQKGQALRWLLTGIAGITMLVALSVVQLGLLNSAEIDVPADVTVPDVSLSAALVNLLLALVVSGMNVTVIYTDGARQIVRRVVGRFGNFNPASSVHAAAVVLCLSLLSLIIGQFVLGGGLSGLAESIEETGIDSGQLIFQGVLWVIVSFLGVGLAIRRSPQQSMERLGLRIPTRDDLISGISIGLTLFILSIGVFAVWTAFTPPEQLAEQTVATEQIGNAIDSLALAFLVSFSAAVGEEIFFRGALQPVFGIILSSLYFALFHTQYTLTPATLLILLVSLGLGWLRTRHSTSAAIIAHFVYNFVSLVLALSGFGGSP